MKLPGKVPFTNYTLHLKRVLVEQPVNYLSTAAFFFYLTALFMIVSCFRIHCCQLLHVLFWIILYIWVNWQAEVFSISSYTEYQLMQPVFWSNQLGKSYTGSKACFEMTPFDLFCILWLKLSYLLNFPRRTIFFAWKRLYLVLWQQ